MSEELETLRTVTERLESAQIPYMDLDYLKKWAQELGLQLILSKVKK